MDTTLHRYTLEAIKTARRAGRSDGGGGGGGGGRPAYIFNRALPPVRYREGQSSAALVSHGSLARVRKHGRPLGRETNVWVVNNSTVAF